MHVAYVNYGFDPRWSTPDELLRSAVTVAGWAEGLAAAGARASVVQRFRSDAAFARGGVECRFVADPPGWRSRGAGGCRAAVRAFFDRRLSFEAVGRRALAAYGLLLERRQAPPLDGAA